MNRAIIVYAKHSLNSIVRGEQWPEGRMQRIMVSMRKDDLDALDRVADMLRQSRSSLIRRAVREMLEKTNKYDIIR